MKTIYESILKSVGAGKSSIENYIKSVNVGRTAMYYDFQDITFKEFIDCVDSETMTKCLKWCFKDATKQADMGRITLRFKDGNFGVEIMSMGAYFSSGDKWWREAFVKTVDLNDDGKTYNPKWLVTSYNYMDAYHKAGDNGACTFKSKKGERLKNVINDYIDYLKKNYKALYD